MKQPAGSSHKLINILKDVSLKFYVIANNKHNKIDVKGTYVSRYYFSPRQNACSTEGKVHLEGSYSEL
jgi:hypothetical protein